METHKTYNLAWLHLREAFILGWVHDWEVFPIVKRKCFNELYMKLTALSKSLSLWAYSVSSDHDVSYLVWNPRMYHCHSQWSGCLRHELPSLVQTLRPRFRIPLEALRFSINFICVVLWEGRELVSGLSQSMESYQPYRIIELKSKASKLQQICRTITYNTGSIILLSEV